MAYINNCKNDLCIYWKNNSCVLDSISLDNLGNCEDCIYVSISKELLEKIRIKFLSAYQDD